MTDLLSELEAVVWLAEKATPGPWHRHTDCPGKCCWHVFTAQDGIYGPETDNAGDSWLINSPEMAEEDAAYIVALSNFLRTHHAEIAEAVRDASRYRWIREVASRAPQDFAVVEDAAFVSIYGNSHNFDMNIDAAMAQEGAG